MRAQRGLWATAWIGCLLLSACSRALRPTAGAAVRPGGELKLIYQNAPDTLDPQALGFLVDAEIASFVYEGLVGHGDTPAAVRPLLAESWQESEGGREWTFTLRPDAWFHDDPCFPEGRGRRVTAQDVRYTLERIAQPGTEWANWYLFSSKIEGIDDYHAKRAGAIRGVDVLDERRVRIRLTRPYASFLKILASQTAFIVAREAVDAYGESFGKHPVGAGPFRMVRWKPLEQILLVRHSRYWGSGAGGARLPYLAGVDIRFRADATEPVLVGAFLKGETHVLAAQEKLLNSLGTDESNPQKRFRLAGVLPSMSMRFVGFSMNNGSVLARHPELRRAIALAFERSQFGRGLPQFPVQLAETLVPPALLGRTGRWHAFDPEQAGALFAPYLKELAASPPVLASNFASAELILLRQGLARFSVPTRVRIRPVGYYPYIAKERPDLFRVSFIPSFGDPEDYYCLFYSKSSPDVNLTAYRNPEYDRVLETAMAEMNPARRTDLFLRLEEMLRNDVPALYLSHGAPTQVATASHLQGVVVRLFFPDFTAAWFAEPEAGSHAAQPAQ